MNGSLDTYSKEETIKLKRGPAGLGFNIVGGVDQQYVYNDSGIYVSKIKEDGAAAQDGRLQEGDKIISINGSQLEGRSHRAVVDLFRTAGEEVELCVMKKVPGHMNGSSGSEPEHQPPVLFLGILGVLGAAAALLYIYKRHI
ncbi:synaptojanin-2-binding protein [Archocentrus centrarchus]|uniref:synaptojanin-2-binding protein n=1 Tax=Archocentrus centrarchus TaxID=63155 RepID=UPI0011EA016A|nr:synaptojanin-2-binding protein [Archocentrus centrarchus]